MHVSHWKIFTDAKTEQKARKVYQRFLQQLGRETGEPAVEAYHKGGFVVSFQVELSETNWNTVVVAAIALAQRVGRSWVITGDITHELDGWSTDPMIAGVTDIHLMLENGKEA